MVSVSAAVRDTKEAACLPVPKAFSTSSFASTSVALQLRSLVWSQIYSGTHKHVTPATLLVEGGGSGRCEKPENSQEVTFLRPTPQPAFKEVATQETGDLWFYIHFENMNIFYNWGAKTVAVWESWFGFWQSVKFRSHFPQYSVVETLLGFAL